MFAVCVQLACLLCVQHAGAEDQVKASKVAAAVEQMRGFSMRFRPSGRSDGAPDPGAIKRDNIVKTLRSGGSASIDALAKQLKSPDLSMRRNASFILGELAGVYDGPKMDIKAAIPALTDAIADTNFEVRVWSMSALASLGPAAKSAVPALKKALQDKDPGIRTNAKAALADIEPAKGK